MHQASEQYVGVINNEVVCHTGVIQFPMRKGWKRVHRLVVLPDYQGIGIGTKFIGEIAKIYADKGYEFNLTTTTPALVKSLCKKKCWQLIRYGRSQSTYDAFSKKYGEENSKTKHLSNSKSNNRITYSFMYKNK